MSGRTAVIAGSTLGLVLMGLFAYRPVTHHAVDSGPGDRLATLRLAEAMPEEGVTAIAQRAAARRSRQAQGMSDEELQQIIRTHLASSAPTEAEMRRWFDANRELFGKRSFEQSRFSVDRLVRIERTRAHLAALGVVP